MPRRYSMDSRAAESDATNREILAAVVRVAAGMGLDALTVQAVAKEADVALRTVYNHFASKEALLAAALGDLAESTRAMVTSIAIDDRSAREQLLAFVDAYLVSYEEQGVGIRVLMGASDIEVVAAAVDDVRAWRREQLTSILRRARTEGSLELAVDEAVDIAYLATAYATFATLTADIGREPAGARSVIRTTLDRALFGTDA